MSRVVVGAAIVRDGMLLAQCRAAPPDLAGRWELPGGQVEPGESERAALRRECLEELGAEVLVHERVGRDLPLSPRSTLRIYLATLAPTSSEPHPVEHRALRWLEPASLPDVEWLPADRLLLPDLAAAMTRTW